ncbi:hypothetical protein [Micromonospora sp. CA-248212]|uniref:hypothetical protein n=1 Tax=Micromonospora sp. CA-248212 TaxID=3239961 RepID=UPI003D8E5AE1
MVGLRGRRAGDAGRGGAYHVVDRGHALPGGDAGGALGQHLAGHLPTEVLADTCRAAGHVAAQGGQRRDRTAGEPADRRSAQIGQVDAVCPARRVLVRLRGEADPGLLGRLLQPFPGGALGEPTYAALGDLLGRAFAGLLEPAPQRLTGQLPHEAFEDLLDE